MVKIAVVGAGAAGLCAARHCLDENFDVDVFEQTGNVGGTWNYTDEVGFDKYGVPVHSAMYKDLRVNLPKELMELDGEPYEGDNVSFVESAVVLDYLTKYCKKFKIEPCVKLYTQVLKIEPLQASAKKWSVAYKQVKMQEIEHDEYDAVIVCNGHYKDTYTPEIPGAEKFSGRTIHSHDYRTREPYKNQKVLIVGSSFSGLEIANQISTVAEKIFLSHPEVIDKPVPEKVAKKGLVVELARKAASFEDGTTEEIDDIIYCTGYIYNFPFLTPECGVQVEDNWVHPLYKQMISIENPTLAFIGLPFIGCPFPIFGIQTRFFVSTLTGHLQLPSKEAMREDLEREIAAKSGLPLRKRHQLDQDQGHYFDDLATTAKIKSIPPVIHKLFCRVKCNYNRDLNFRIIDDDNFEQIN